MAYPNLDAEMTRRKIKRDQIADLINKGSETVSSRITGSRGDFYEHEAQEIRDKYFPGLSLDYLFSQKPITSGQSIEA